MKLRQQESASCMSERDEDVRVRRRVVTQHELSAMMSHRDMPLVGQDEQRFEDLHTALACQHVFRTVSRHDRPRTLQKEGPIQPPFGGF